MFHKLSREKPREKWILPYYTLFILLYPFAHVWSVKTPSKEEKQRKSTKVSSPWRAKASWSQKASEIARPQLATVRRRRAKSVSTRDHSPPTRNNEWKTRKLAMASGKASLGHLCSLSWILDVGHLCSSPVHFIY